MIKADQIPYDVVRAAYSAWAGGGGNNVLSAMENAIAAALNAWPGMIKGQYDWEPAIILPLPQEASDD